MLISANSPETSNNIFAQLKKSPMTVKDFTSRHVGPNEAEKQLMLEAIGVSSIDELMDKIVPSQIDYLRLLTWTMA